MILSNSMIFLSRLKKIFKRENNLGEIKSFPIKVELSAVSGKLKFEAFSPVELFRTAQYGNEKEFVNKFIEKLFHDDIVFDFGASVGLITVHAASFLERGRVFAFEPDPETSKRLIHNVELNNLSNVEYIPWAVGDTNGETILFSDGASGFAPTLKKQKNRTGTPTGRIKIQSRTLDDAILSKDLPVPTVLKIDIEGAEILCLKGASELLSGGLGKKPRLIFLELHPDFLPSFNSSADQVHGMVLGFGYGVIWEHKREDQVHYCYQKLNL